MSERIPLAVPDLRGREAEYLQNCVRDNWVSSAGPYVAEFEQRVAGLAGRPHGVATVNGTAALHLALIVAGVMPGDFVIVPDWTFAATANAVRHAGATPLLVDIDPASWTLDPALTGDALSDFSEGRIGAVIAVDALGHPADFDALEQSCGRAGVPLVEDAAGAIGARYKDRPAGGGGTLGVFSFNGNKTVTAGGGGAIVAEREEWAARARHLGTQARPGTRYRHDEVGYNYRMTNVNAAIGLAQLERLDEMLAAKRRIAGAYDTAFAGRDDMAPMPRMKWAESGCWLYSVISASPADADGLVAQLAEQGIEARVFWEALSSQPAFEGVPRVLSGASASISGRVVSLPCSSGLSEAQQARVIEAVGAWRGGRLAGDAEHRSAAG